MNLKDKVAIVTGGGSGIGEAISKRFAKEGAKVLVADIDKVAATRVVKEIQESGGQATAATVDVSRKDQIHEVISDMLPRWGRIDILVNNAGIGEDKWFAESDESVWDRVIAINMKGTILFTHAVLPTMMEQKHGKIINIASAAGKVGQGRGVVYSATKAAVDVLAKALAREVARYRINVNSICPGPTDTPLFAQDPELGKKIAQGVPLKRIAKPEEIASAALFLASEESDFITGHSLLVDGGITMI